MRPFSMDSPLMSTTCSRSLTHLHRRQHRATKELQSSSMVLTAENSTCPTARYDPSKSTATPILQSFNIPALHERKLPQSTGMGIGTVAASDFLQGIPSSTHETPLPIRGRI